MAVDTAAKRRSMLNFADDNAMMMALSDGTISQADRQQLLGLYSGILLVPRGTTASTDPDSGLLYWGMGAGASNRSTPRQRA